MILGIREFQRLPRFDRAYKKLEPQIQFAVDDAIRDLCANPIPPGRKVKRDKAARDIWTARVNRNYRFSFELKDGICILRNVDSHDELYAST